MINFRGIFSWKGNSKDAFSASTTTTTSTVSSPSGPNTSSTVQSSPSSYFPSLPWSSGSGVSCAAPSASTWKLFSRGSQRVPKSPVTQVCLFKIL